MKEPIKIFIVEDDFRVAEITKKFVGKLEGFEVTAAAKTAEETKQLLREEEMPDLFLLDVYIPDADGMSLFWFLRRNYPKVQIIMITAAKETDIIAETFQGSVFDYILKPVNFNRLQESLLHFQKRKEYLQSNEEITQKEIDNLLSFTTLSTAAPEDATQLPKGIDPITLEQIEKLLRNGAEGMTAVEIGRQIGASRSTARRYLEFLVTVKQVEATLKYGDVGRPERRYFSL